MARNDYLYGDVGAVQPVEPVTSSARQEIQANPAAFGAAQAQASKESGAALGQLGHEATATGKTFGQIAADDATNQLMPALDNILHGTGQTGPDGKVDSGALGLQGRDALNQQKDILKSVDDTVQKYRNQISDPMAQVEFDRQSKYLRSHAVNVLGSHFEQQRRVYEDDVDKASIAAPMASIARNAADDVHFNNSLTDIKNFAADSARRKGGDESVVQSAVNSATGAAWDTRLRSIAAADHPEVAMKLAEEHKNELSVPINPDHPEHGTFYDQLAPQLRQHADKKIGQGVGQGIMRDSLATHADKSPLNPVYHGAAEQGPMSASGLARTIQIESAGKGTAGAGTSHVGYAQFSPATAAAVGITDRTDFAQSVYGTQRYASMNAPVLKRTLGRDPTDAELYLAHQQGPAGASKLFANPDARAGDLVGDAAIRGNGGDPNATARQFTSMWIAKFNGTPFMTTGPAMATFKSPQLQAATQPAPTVASPQPVIETESPETPRDSVGGFFYDTAKQDAYRALEARDDLSPEQREYARREISEQLQIQEAAYGQNERARKQANEAAALEIQDMIYNGHADKALQVLNTRSDPRLSDPHLRDNLRRIALADDANSPIRDKVRYGPGYSEALNRLTLLPGDPARISGGAQIVAMHADGQLTEGGARNLHSLLQMMQKDENGPLYTQVLNGKVQYAKNRLRLDEELYPGAKIPNPKGEAIFQNEFLPAFNDALRNSKDPADFLRNQKNIDDILAPMVTRARRAAAEASMGAQAQVTDEQKRGQAAFLVPPSGVKPEAWQTLMAQPPQDANGTPTPLGHWSGAIMKLDKLRSPQAIHDFKEKWPDSDPAAILRELDESRGKRHESRLVPNQGEGEAVATLGVRG